MDIHNSELIIHYLHQILLHGEVFLGGLQAILTCPINLEIIEQQYDELIKLTTALRLGTADAESMLRRSTKRNAQHPTYKALCELDKTLKTIFLCDYLRLESLRREIQDRLQSSRTGAALTILSSTGRVGSSPATGGKTKRF